MEKTNKITINGITVPDGTDVKIAVENGIQVITFSKESEVEKPKFKNGDIIYVQERTGGCVIWDKKNDSSTFSNCEIASISLINGVFIYRELWNGMLKTENSKRIHPTQKPVKLLDLFK